LIKEILLVGGSFYAKKSSADAACQVLPYLLLLTDGASNHPYFGF